MKANRELYHRACPHGAEMPGIRCATPKHKSKKTITNDNDKEKMLDAFYGTMCKMKTSFFNSTKISGEIPDVDYKELMPSRKED
jgi:hypothetical protein